MPLPCFAYGSNTDAADWRRWCDTQGIDAGGVQPVGTALLPDHALCFDYFSRGRGGGALNLRHRPGGYVEGVLLQADAAGWAALDRKEGAPDWYQRVQRTAILADGTAQPVATYVVAPHRLRAHCPPSDAYRDIVCRGFAAHGLDPAPVLAAAEHGEGCHPLPWVFTYGTLMRGESNHQVASGAPGGLLEAVPARATGRLHDLGAYPGLALDPAVPVAGELLRFGDIAAALVAMDALEDALPMGAPGGMYRRTILAVTDAAGRRRRAWAYVMEAAALAGAPVIAAGDWRRR